MSLLALLLGNAAPPGPDPDPDPPTDPEALTTLRHVTNNSAWWRASSVGAVGGTTIITRHEVRAPAKALRIGQGVHGWAGADAGVSGSAGIVMPSGAFHRLTWGGFERVTIPRLEYRMSDPLPDVAQVEAGDVIHVVWEASAGDRYPSGYLSMPANVKAALTGPYQGVVPTMISKTISGAPVGIYGLTNDANYSIALIGDSFLERGWGRFALDDHGVAWSDLSQWAEGTPTGGLPAGRFPTSGDFPYDTVITGYGGNNSTSSLPSQQSTHISHWFVLAETGAKVAAMTLHPYTDSTDSWTTVEGQTWDTGRDQQARIDRNDWLRDGAPLDPTTRAPGVTGTSDPAYVRIGEDGHPLAYPVFDQADACETSRNSGIWKVQGGAWTADGTHLSVHGSEMLQPYFKAWLEANLT